MEDDKEFFKKNWNNIFYLMCYSEISITDIWL